MNYFTKIKQTAIIIEIVIKINGPFITFQQYKSTSDFKNLPFYFSLSFKTYVNFN